MHNRETDEQGPTLTGLLIVVALFIGLVLVAKHIENPERRRPKEQTMTKSYKN